MENNIKFLIFMNSKILISLSQFRYLMFNDLIRDVEPEPEPLEPAFFGTPGAGAGFSMTAPAPELALAPAPAPGQNSR